MTMTDVDLQPIIRLTRDVRKAATTLSDSEARYLVDQYYTLQKYRIRADNQVRSLTKPNEEEQPAEPHETVSFFAAQFETLENSIKSALETYSLAQIPGNWARSICGIGPVLAAGVLAHIDITKAPPAGHIWRYAGLDPTVTWEKKTKRPWNASLKVVTWKIGESFVKVHNNESDYYGHVYAERKAWETAKNDAGDYHQQAEQALSAKKYGDDTTAKEFYSQGKLPPGRIHARAKRYAVKLFLSHYQHVAYQAHYGSPPPKPYVLTHLQHAHYLAPPNWIN